MMPVVYRDPSQADQIEEEDVAWQIVEAIKHGYIKKPWSTVTGRGSITVRCKLKYLKHGNRAFRCYGTWEEIFHNLFISNRGDLRHSDHSFNVTKGTAERVRNLVISALSEKVVKEFCLEMAEARDRADVNGARRKHKKSLARRRFKDKALEAAKQGLSREEMIEIVNEAMINDVMTE